MLQTEKREGAKVCLLLEFDFFRLRKFQLPVVRFVARKCFFFFSNVGGGADRFRNTGKGFNFALGSLLSQYR